jgi:hypothetical protein
VASILYRTKQNGAICTDSSSDVKAVVRYRRAHAATYVIYPAKVAVWPTVRGWSPGLNDRANGLKQFDVGANLDQSSDVQAVVDTLGAGER